LTKLFNVSFNVNGVDEAEAKLWIGELENVFADIEIDNVSVSNDRICFSAGLSGNDDTAPDDIRIRLNEYLAMNEKPKIPNKIASPIIIEPL
jgi:hypothetical protein